MSLGAPFAVLAHVSDMHLGRNITDVGNHDRASLVGLWRTRRLPMQAHDSFILASLRTELMEAVRSVAGRSTWDFTVITGDISTTADCDERFTFAYDYITTGTMDFGGGQHGGLDLAEDRVFCVPGNHDKLGERSLERYLRAFGGLPDPPPYCKLGRCGRDGQRNVVFLGIDSNRYDEHDIAVGQVSPATLSWLNSTLAKHDWPDGAVVILLLHHHPADLNPYRPTRRWGFQTRFTILDEGERLLKSCEGRVHIIMHGHEHFPVSFLDPVSSSIVISAGTVAEYQRRGREPNSFMIVRLCPGGVGVTQFDWNGGRYAPRRLEDRQFPWPKIGDYSRALPLLA